MRRGTLGGMSNSAASLTTQSNIASQTAGSFLSSCILLMVTFDSAIASNRSQSGLCKKIVNATVLLKMYSVTTRDMMNSNLSMAARCIPALSSPSSCRVSRTWATTGNAFLKMYNVSALLDHLDGQLFVYEMICRKLPTLPNVSYATVFSKTFSEADIIQMLTPIYS